MVHFCACTTNRNCHMKMIIIYQRAILIDITASVTNLIFFFNYLYLSTLFFVHAFLSPESSVMLLHSMFITTSENPSWSNDAQFVICFYPP